MWRTVCVVPVGRLVELATMRVPGRLCPGRTRETCRSRLMSVGRDLCLGAVMGLMNRTGERLRVLLSDLRSHLLHLAHSSRRASAASGGVSRMFCSTVVVPSGVRSLPSFQTEGVPVVSGSGRAVDGLVQVVVLETNCCRSCIQNRCGGENRVQ
jgi:hypothetical protein